MVAFKIAPFGGMVPAIDDRLLPEGAASYVENAWLYSGRLEGIREATKVWTAPNDSVKRVYRVPKEYVDKEHIADSYWFGFNRPDTDIVKAPVIDDSFKRYYWTDDENKPKYNTLARMIAGDAAYLLGVPYPDTAPSVTPGNTTDSVVAYRGGFRLTGIAATLRYIPAAGPSTPTIKVVKEEYAVSGRDAQFRIVRKVSGHKNYIFSCQTLSFNADLNDKTLISANFNILNPDLNAPSIGNGDIAVTRAYVYTWVTAFGEESAPSPAVVQTGSQDGKWYVYLTAPTATQSANRNLTKTRIYRTVTSASGLATYYLVVEQDIAILTFTDEVSDDTVTGNNQLESGGWVPPPTDLKGLIAMPNGILAGFRGNEVYFCEPYRPHAWPVSYIIQTEYDVVGLGVTGQSLAILTESQPYVATGSTPANMTASKMSAFEPCMSKGSIVSSPSGVFFVSPNGLITIGPGMIQNLTEKMFSRDKWQKTFPLSRTRAARLGTSGYYFWGYVRPGMFQEDAFQTTAFETNDYTGAYTGALIELGDARVAMTTLHDDLPVTNVTTDGWTGEILVQRGQDVYMVDVASSTAAYSPFVWRSKVFQPNDKKNFQAMKIFFDQSVVADDYGTVRAYANGQQVFERPITMSGQLIRLPDGFRADFWQLEIESSTPVYSVEVATSAKELRSV